MLPCFLILVPYGKQSSKIELFDGNVNNTQRVNEESVDTQFVYSDLEYEFDFDYPDIPDVNNISVYINDVFEPAVYKEGKITFLSDENTIKKIFVDCYGFVEIGLKVLLNDGRVLLFKSKYLPVLVKKGQFNEAVKAMVRYVYSHQEELLFNGLPQPKSISGLKEGGRKTLTSKIILAEELAAVYEESYGYFKANSRFHIEKTPKIEHLERLQYVTAETIAHLVSHPEQLKPINSTAGILIGDRIYQPQKVLSLQNVCSYDIYENRIIVGFLRRMLDEILELKKHCEDLLSQIPKEENYNSEYVYSSFFMFLETKRMLDNGLKRLAELYNKFASLWNIYRTAIPVSEEPIKGRPHPSAIFMSVPQYNRIFVRIHQWLNYGIYAFEKERFMFSFIKVSSLYENYLLVKLLVYFKIRGYTKTINNRYVYPVHDNWKYKNSLCMNTFSFSSNKCDVTLYFQPVIFTTDYGSVNGIGLYRNNTLPAKFEQMGFEQGGQYYVPDYLIKFEDGQGTRYVILDAKFSEISNIRKYYIKELAFKYLFSISPVSSRDQLVGLCVFYGKCSDSEKLQSVYDKQISSNEIMPFAEMLPMIEGIATDSHYEQLDKLFSKVVKQK